jgi:AcrR family transcriptional regulator
MANRGMTRSSFYHYFRSLDEVAIASVGELSLERQSGREHYP